MLRRLRIAILLAALGAGCVAAATQESLREQAEPGEALASPRDATALSHRFLEWLYLGDWVRHLLLGGDSESPARRWASLVSLREAGQAWPGEEERRRRGLCVYEARDPSGPELLALCDSLNAGRYEPVTLLVEGMLEGYLLRRRGLPGCGIPGDPTKRLRRSLPEAPALDLEQLKRDMDFPALFFAAEREVQRLGRDRLAPVEQFLAQEGLLITLRYGFRKQYELSSPRPPRRVDEGHLIYPAGLSVDWGEGRRLVVRQLPVLHALKQNLFQVVEPGIALQVWREGESYPAEYGEFKLNGTYRFASEHVTLEASGGRYRRDGKELRIWWPSSFFGANRNSLLYSLLILLVTGYLLLLGRRKRRELLSPMQIRRPRP